MLEFVRNVFRGFFSFMLWVCLIGCAVVGAIIGSNGFGGTIIGIIIGILVGIIIDIIGGGLIATLLNMDENLEITARNMSKLGNNSQLSQKNISDSGNMLFVGKLQRKCERCKKEVDDGYSKCPHCGNDTFE